uniref:Uncharacterized protein n=1 Tax=Ciona savignyi TaxID=51511 RepID=H2ZIP6_CIOSA
MLREIPSSASPSNMRRHTRENGNELSFQNHGTQFRLTQNASTPQMNLPSHQTAGKADAEKKDSFPAPKLSEDSLTRLMNFMNTDDRSPSATTHPRRYQGRKRGEGLTPSGNIPCGNFPKFSTPFASPSTTDAANSGKPPNEPEEELAPSDNPVTGTFSQFLSTLAAPSTTQDENSNRLSTSEPSLVEEKKFSLTTPIPGGDLIPRTPVHAARSTSSSKLWRQSTSSSDHDAWWMPREWAQERCIGAYGLGWKFEEDENMERERDTQTVKEANIEKIRTCNFILL